jgi:transposase-like protein
MIAHHPARTLGASAARVIENTRSETLRKFVDGACSNPVSLIRTDTLSGYDGLKRGYFHRSVDHSKGQCVVCAVHTQTIEGFWSILKRGVVGTYHKVSAKYLPLYIAEFEFRYNNRGNADIFGAAVGAM